MTDLMTNISAFSLSGLKMMIETNGGAESNQSAVMKAVEERLHLDRENISASKLLK
jgi:hypothetical protein